MKNIYVKDLLEKCKCTLVQGDKDTILNSFSKDTRTIKNGDVFIGIKGDNFDGSSLYLEALEKGACGCILNNNIELNKEISKKYADRFIVTAENTIKVLQDLASYKRSLYDIPVIGITGSVGKTSTKDIIASVLSEKFNVLKTEGNLNNHIGLPLTILKLKDHNCLVVEMGMNNLGEISILSKIAKPTIAIITNVGTAHIGNLGSRENILKAKLEILDGLQNGKIILNNDNDLLTKWYQENKKRYEIITYGVENSSDYMAYDITLNKDNSIFKVNNNLFKINIPGIHFVYNSLCALAVGNIFAISTEKIKQGIENFTLTKRRMEIVNVNNYTIINDSYNANPDSVMMALTYLGSLKSTRKIAVLGDMLELGDYSEKLHRSLAKTIINNKIDILITVGRNAKYISEECLNLGFNKDNIYIFNNNKEAIEKIKEIKKVNDSILLKASYGMNFIEIYNNLIEKERI